MDKGGQNNKDGGREISDTNECDETAATAIETAKRSGVFEHVREALSLGRSAGGVHKGHRKRLRRAALRDRTLSGFSDIELIELLLSFVIPQKDTNVTAHRLLDRFGTVLGVLKAKPDELSKMPCMTRQAADLLPELIRIGIFNGCADIELPNKEAAIDFMAGVCFGGNGFGLFALFADRRGKLLGIERLSDGDMDIRTVVAASMSRGACRVLIVRRDDALFPTEFGLAYAVKDVHTALTSVGIELWDFLIYTDFGYYTVGEPPVTPGWFPLFMFMPMRKGSGSTEILRKTYAADSGQSRAEKSLLISELPEQLHKVLKKTATVAKRAAKNTRDGDLN